MNNRERSIEIVDGGYEKFLQSELDNAQRHYEDSVLKLALRITAKAFDINKMKVTTGRVGMNIETTITDGTETIEAWTIIAEGEINRPHYRYLVR